MAHPPEFQVVHLCISLPNDASGKPRRQALPIFKRATVGPQRTKCLGCKQDAFMHLASLSAIGQYLEQPLSGGYKTRPKLCKDCKSGVEKKYNATTQPNPNSVPSYTSDVRQSSIDRTYWVGELDFTCKGTLPRVLISVTELPQPSDIYDAAWQASAQFESRHPTGYQLADMSGDDPIAGGYEPPLEIKWVYSKTPLSAIPVFKVPGDPKCFVMKEYLENFLGEELPESKSYTKVPDDLWSRIDSTSLVGHWDTTFTGEKRPPFLQDKVENQAFELDADRQDLDVFYLTVVAVKNVESPDRKLRAALNDALWKICKDERGQAKFEILIKTDSEISSSSSELIRRIFRAAPLLTMFRQLFSKPEEWQTEKQVKMNVPKGLAGLERNIDMLGLLDLFVQQSTVLQIPNLKKRFARGLSGPSKRARESSIDNSDIAVSVYDDTGRDTLEEGDVGFISDEKFSFLAPKRDEGGVKTGIISRRHIFPVLGQHDEHDNAAIFCQVGRVTMKVPRGNIRCEDQENLDGKIVIPSWDEEAQWWKGDGSAMILDEDDPLLLGNQPVIRGVLGRVNGSAFKSDANFVQIIVWGDGFQAMPLLVDRLTARVFELEEEVDQTLHTLETLTARTTALGDAVHDFKDISKMHSSKSQHSSAKPFKSCQLIQWIIVLLSLGLSAFNTATNQPMDGIAHQLLSTERLQIGISAQTESIDTFVATLHHGTGMVRLCSGSDNDDLYCSEASPAASGMTFNHSLFEDAGAIGRPCQLEDGGIYGTVASVHAVPLLPSSPAEDDWVEKESIIVFTSNSGLYRDIQRCSPNGDIVHEALKLGKTGVWNLSGSVLSDSEGELIRHLVASSSRNLTVLFREHIELNISPATSELVVGPTSAEALSEFMPVMDFLDGVEVIAISDAVLSRELAMTLSRKLEHSKHIQRILLRYCRVIGGLEELIAAIFQRPYISVVELIRSGVTDTHIDVLSHPPYSLESLTLGKYDLSEEGVKTLQDSLSRVAVTIVDVETRIDCADANYMEELTNRLTFHTIHIANCGDRAMGDIARRLLSVTLTSLVVVDSVIVDDVANLVASKVPDLAHLTLTSSSISPKGMKSIGIAAANSTLVTLDTPNNTSWFHLEYADSRRQVVIHFKPDDAWVEGMEETVVHVLALHSDIILEFPINATETFQAFTNSTAIDFAAPDTTFTLAFPRTASTTEVESVADSIGSSSIVNLHLDVFAAEQAIIVKRGIARMTYLSSVVVLGQNCNAFMILYESLTSHNPSAAITYWGSLPPSPTGLPQLPPSVLCDLNVERAISSDGHTFEMVHDPITNWSIVAEAIAALPRLKTVSFRGNGNVDAIAIAEALKSLTSLEYFDLRGNGISGAGAIAIADALKSLTSLKRFDIAYNDIGVAGAIAIAEAVPSLTSLEYFDLRGNGIGDAGAIAIAEALKSLTSLKQFDIGFNGIGYAVIGPPRSTVLL